MPDLVLVGAGGFAREVLAVLAAANDDTVAPARLNLVGLIDDDAATAGSELWASRGVPYLGTVEQWVAQDRPTFWLIAIGKPDVRSTIAARLAATGLGPVPALRHPTAIVTPTATVGPGSVLCPGAWVGPEVRIGAHAHLNVGTVVGHDAVLGDCVSLNPLVAVCGAARIADQVLLGVSSSVLEGRSVGTGAVVGGGACVVRDVAAGGRVVGVPARALD